MPSELDPLLYPLCQSMLCFPRRVWGPHFLRVVSGEQLTHGTGMPAVAFVTTGCARCSLGSHPCRHVSLMVGTGDPTHRHGQPQQHEQCLHGAVK